MATATSVDTSYAVNMSTAFNVTASIRFTIFLDEIPSSNIKYLEDDATFLADNGAELWVDADMGFTVT